jgi:hypothetical protein
MSDKTTYAHGFGGMNADTPVHPKVKGQSELSATAGSALEKSVESAHWLAMLALQSERYSADHEYRNAVDAVLSWSLPAWTAQCQAPKRKVSDER